MPSAENVEENIASRNGGETSAAAPKRSAPDRFAGAAWYYSTNEEWWNEAGSRDAAIAEGGDAVDPGEGFWIAQAFPKGPWPTLFHDIDDLAEFIDDRNEDNSFEDAFTEEAGLSKDDLTPLAAAINALWSDFLAKRNPLSRALIIGPSEYVVIPTPDEVGTSEPSDGAHDASAKADSGPTEKTS
jgi:hypothetical protein